MEKEIKEKPKTLKEIELPIGRFQEKPFNEKEDYLVKSSDLKAEAVKIIKWLREEDDYDKHNMYDVILCGLGISWEECSDIEAVINFLKWWLDLTEDDLK